MTRFFLLMLILIVGAFVGAGMVLRQLKRIFRPFQSNINSNKKKSKMSENQQVLYNKDGITVLKGDADTNPQKD